MDVGTKFKDIKYSQIRTLLEILSKSSSSDKEFIRSLFLKESPNYENTIEFLTEIGIITSQDEKILLIDSISSYILKTTKDDDSLKNCLMEIIINNKVVFSQFVKRYLDNFILKDSSYSFKPSTEENLKYSWIRNFLMELELIEFNRGSNTYYISEKYHHIIGEYLETRMLSPDELEAIQDRQKVLGTSAELKIIEYEKERLNKSPYLVEKIQHVALKDTRAGYDILSFDLPDNSGDFIERYIEVKAVSISNFRFYLTDNEIKKSILYNEQYYLYLLPIICKNKFDLESMEIVQNPYENIINDQEKWHKEVDKYVIIKK